MLAALLYMQGSRWWYGLVLAIGVMFTKFTTIPGLFVAFTYSNRKVRDAALGIVTVALILSIFAFQGVDVSAPIKGEDGGIAGVNITVILDRLTGSDHTLATQRVFSLIAIMAFGAMLYVCRRKKLPVLDTLCVCVMVLLLFTPKSFKFYRLWFVGPLTIWSARNGRFGRYSLYSALLCVFDDFTFGVGVNPALLAVMYVLALAITAMEIWFIRDILKTHNRDDHPLEGESIEQLAAV
jgi:hypothetical protein